ncbi:MAG: OmpA family protein [Rhodospirillales bacterium]|nr:OmpA family protein [Rhodospirillales bacterium]MBO6787467.1 OmpA family protein [Rhodospirillales bacterium]
MSQTSSYQPATDNVYINWGALNGGAAPAMPQQQPAQSYSYAPSAQGGLLMPGPTMPRSQLHVAAPSGSAGVMLKKPGSAPKMAAKPAPAAPAPAPMPKAAEMPKPAAAAPTQLAEKKAPPPPPAAEPEKQPEAAAAPPPPPAPETASAPPPPPMPAASEPPAAPTVEQESSAPEAPKPTEQAATSTATPADGPVKVVFNGDDTKLSADGQQALQSVLDKLSQNENARVQLMAYAAGEDLTSSKARRISLSRALSVRSFLIEKGVRSTRIDVRALGDKSEGEPRNRVDVNVDNR